MHFISRRTYDIMLVGFYGFLYYAELVFDHKDRERCLMYVPFLSSNSSTIEKSFSITRLVGLNTSIGFAKSQNSPRHARIQQQMPAPASQKT